MATSAESSSGNQKEHAEKVAQHYNNLQETGLEERAKSRIFYMRNFNNWIKSQCIGETLNRIKDDRTTDPRNISVLDLGSGKGGDILKWKKANVSRVVFADIAGTSVEQCEIRYNEMLQRSGRERHYTPFKAQFITADCTKLRLKDRYERPEMFDLVSCQFAFHYSFESYEQAEMMVKNACECLRPGGYFIGTTPNSYELTKRLNESDSLSFGNEVYKVTFDSKTSPLFGAKYDFHLEGVVDCPEFLVYFPALEKIAAKYNMKLIKRVPFAEYFEEQIKNSEGRGLIGRMQALEPYPPDEDVESSSSEPDAYTHAKSAAQRLSAAKAGDDNAGRRKPPKVGTLSQSEWEASTIYCFFMFQKQGDIPSHEKPSSDGARNLKRAAPRDDETQQESPTKETKGEEETQEPPIKKTTGDEQTAQE